MILSKLDGLHLSYWDQKQQPEYTQLYAFSTSSICIPDSCSTASCGNNPQVQLRILPNNLRIEVTMAFITPLEVWNALAMVMLSFIVHQLVTKVLWNGLWEPLRLRRIMAKQGVKALPFRFLVGQLPDQKVYVDSFPEVVPIDSYAAMSPTVTPQYALFFPKFPGEKCFLYWLGKSTRLVVRDAELARELFCRNHSSLKWCPSRFWFLPLIIGRGLVTHAGEKWAMERRTVNPFFRHHALEAMLDAMVEGTGTEIHKWEQIVAQAGGSAEIDVEPDVHRISGRVLSLTAFGGDFEAGERIYLTMNELAQELFETSYDAKFWLIPFYRKIPTKQNRHIDQMISKVDTLLREAIHARLQAIRNQETSSHSNDLLGRMFTAATDGWDEDSLQFNMASVLNNCKLLYFAGQDTVANAVGFTMLMLALHPEWQERARQEVLEVLGDEENFNASVFARLEVVGMIVNETLRTFSPVPTIAREVTKDLHLKNLFIPKGIEIEFAAGAVHQDKEYWGDDVAEYKPERFSNGVLAACSHPQAFNPFGIGSKICIGNNFAMMEMKIIVARVLRRFELLPSPNYKHHPVFAMVTRPKHGFPIVLKAL